MTAAIVLGAAVWANGPSPTLKRRTLHAAKLYHKGSVDRIIVCGGLGRHAPTEAEVMLDILMQESIPHQSIACEDQSRNTGENLRFAKHLLQDDDVIIVTDAYHAPRARLIARRLGINAQSSSPSARTGKRTQQIKSALRELPAYLTYWLFFRA